ncbi:MAG: transketolase C-terminal domain-containing protein, partial [Thermoanaerobaculia bacterium]|nr:transketolase C-terminal domain-containing protein [Thermoanaerobaculia bacterium]
LWSLRAIPGLKVFRPADGTEVAMSWAWALDNRESPVAISLTRQNVDPIPRVDEDRNKILRGAYVLAGYDEGAITFLASGSEVPLAVAAADELKEKGIASRVVSAPCLELFDEQAESYQNEVLGEDRSRIVAIEAGATLGWYRYVSRDALVIGIDDFGHSAPYKVIAEKLGFTPESVVERVMEWRGRGER